MSKKAKKATRKRTVSKSTAIARRDNSIQKAPQPELLPAEYNYQALGDSPVLAELGTVQVKLTEAEEKVLAEDVIAADVLIKPTGQPYLPHAKYRKWFDRALGRFAWSLVPKAKPIKVTLPPGRDQEVSTRHVVLVPYMLYVKGAPVAFAYGEQEFNETNSEQTYGDAVEATSSSAIRRLAKAIGVGLELWDRDWLQRWIDTYAVAVKVKSGNYTNTRWRRKVDKPLPGELRTTNAGQGYDDAHDGEIVDQAPRRRPDAGNDGNGEEKITKPQRQRLATIANKAGRSHADVQLWLRGKWKVNSSADIKRKDYDQVCRELEARGPLALPGDGEGK